MNATAWEIPVVNHGAIFQAMATLPTVPLIRFFAGHVLRSGSTNFATHAPAHVCYGMGVASNPDQS